MKALTGAALAAFAIASSASSAENLYRGSNWSAMTADRRASAIGDALTVIIFQSAESTNVTENKSQKGTNLSGSISGGHLSESGGLSFGGGYTGHGEVTRSEKFLTQITLSVVLVLPDGDLVVAGQQLMNVNGERTRISVRGRVRTADIAADNTVLSNRIADAQIDYDGHGFVSRSAKPGILNRIFSFLGLG
jgi:flagellar L-ring protein precursor FlgH